MVSYKKEREMKNLKDIFKINESENPSPPHTEKETAPLKERYEFSKLCSLYVTSHLNTVSYI